MARGRDAHQARLSAVAALGKTLTRRAGSRCELCEDTLDLRPFEVQPAPEDPSDIHAALLCGRCREVISDTKRLPRDLDSLRFLETAMWSETPPAQVLAIRLLRRLVAAQVPWAEIANDGLWVDESIEEWVGQS